MEDITKKRLILPTIPRREEEAGIRRAFEEVGDGELRVVFLGGLSGTGKSTIVANATANKVVAPVAAAAANKGQQQQHRRASTKFDHRQNNNAPLANLRQLLSELVEATVNSCCSKSAKALNAELSSHQSKVLRTFTSLDNIGTILISDDDGDEGDGASNNDTNINKNIMESSSNRQQQQQEEESKQEKDPSTIINNEDDDQDDQDPSGERSVATAESSDSNIVSEDGLSVLKSALKACLRAISSVSRIILTLDDIHWACPTTMEVLKDVWMDPTLKNVLVCATYRTKEEATTTATTGFYEWKEQLQLDLGTVRVQTMIVGPLSLDQVQELLAEAVHREVSDVLDLAQVVHGFTHGNLFFIKHFLERLQDDELLIFDLNRFRWQWNADNIKRRSSISDNVVQTLASRIHKLPKPAQNVLMLAACFGAQFDVRALEATKSVLDICCVYQFIEKAKEQEFVIQLHNKTHYRFAHDMIQMAAYGLLPETMDLTRLHWDIGVLLLEMKELLEDDSILFSTVDHLNMAPSAIYSGDHDMQRTLASVNYQAGRKAASLSAFVPAARYIHAGIASLGETPFQCCYNLAYKLYKLAASTEFVVGNMEASQKMAQLVLDNAKTHKEKLNSLLVLIKCKTALNDPQELLNFCLDLLQHMGEKFPRKPNSIFAQLEYHKMKIRLKAMPDEEILNLPPMSDPYFETILHVLQRMIFPCSQLEESLLGTVVACRMIQITLKHGSHKDLTPHTLLIAGTLMYSQSHDVKETYRMGSLGEKIIRQGDGAINGWQASVLGQVASLTKWWLEPLPNCLDVFIECNKYAMRCGEIGDAFHLTIMYAVSYFHAGLPLDPLLQDVEKFCNQYLEYNQETYFFLGSPMWQCLLNLTGRSETPGNLFEGEIATRRNAMSNPSKTGEQSMQVFQMVTSYCMGDLPKATEMAEALKDTKPGFKKASSWFASRRFFLALVAIANFRLTHKRKDKAEAERHTKSFRRVVKEGAINLVHKLQLLEAELMSLGSPSSLMSSLSSMASSLSTTRSSTEGSDDSIVSKYDDAIVSASRAGFLQDAALANYLCFQFCKAKGIRLHLAELYIKRSFELWMDWNAVAVASSLVERHPDIFSSESLRSSLLSVAGSMKDGSTRRMGSSSRRVGGGLRGRSRFDAALSAQHKELDVQ